MSRTLCTFAVLSLLPFLAAGCGVRGNLEAPKEAKDQGQATSPEAADNGSNSSAPPKKHREFVLDPLLR